MKLRKIGAVLAGAAMLGATFVGAVAAGDPVPSGEFFINPDTGQPAVIIVVGSSAAAEDVVSASLVAAKIGTMAFVEEEKTAGEVIYEDKAVNIPLAYQIPSWEATIPVQTYNIPGGPEEGSIAYYKTWGITTHWTPDADAYVVGYAASGRGWGPWNYKYFNEVRVEYTLGGVSASASPGGLWWFDDHDRQRFGNANGVFDAWETHEEIQIRFDDLYLPSNRDKEFQLSGIHFQDHMADLVGGWIRPENFRTWRSLENLFLPQGSWTPGAYPYEDGETIWVSPDIPGLIYRIDNVRRPVQQELVGLFMFHKRTLNEWVDLHQEYIDCVYIPEPYSVYRRWIPKIRVFGKEYSVVDAGEMWNFDHTYRYYDPNWYHPQGIVITGTPHVYVEEYIYKDEPQSYEGYEVDVHDVDVDHNKIYMTVTTPAGDSVTMWMILDPLHGFSATPQLMSQMGEPTEWNGLSNNDIWEWGELPGYRDNKGHYHSLYYYPTFVIDGVATFVGANGTTGALFNLYTLEDVDEWISKDCCEPFTEEPNAYQLWIDQQITTLPQVGGYSQVEQDYMGGYGGIFTAGFGNSATTTVSPGAVTYKGTWDTIDSHATTAGPVRRLPAEGFDPGFAQGPMHIEAVPWPYADRDTNDFVQWWEDCWLANKFSHWFAYSSSTWSTMYGNPPPDGWMVDGGDDPIPGADYMWEMNFALCETIEMAYCETKWEVDGPNHYFTVKVTDGTWDDDKDGWKDTEFDDGIDFEVELRVPGATYMERTSVDIDPAELVKLDVEVDPSAVDKNLILIGGAVANSIVQQLVDMGVGPDDGSAADWFTTEGDFKVYTDPFGTTKDVLVVAGPDREATRAAAMDLISQMG